MPPFLRTESIRFASLVRPLTTIGTINDCIQFSGEAEGLKSNPEDEVLGQIQFLWKRTWSFETWKFTAGPTQFPKGRDLLGGSSSGFNHPFVVLWFKCGFFRR